MGKPVRIYQLARELNVESKEILKMLNEKMNIDLNNHMAAVNDQVAAKIRQMIKGLDEAAPERKETPKQKAATKPSPAAAPQAGGGDTPAKPPVTAARPAAAVARPLESHPETARPKRAEPRAPRPAAGGPRPGYGGGAGGPRPGYGGGAGGDRGRPGGAGGGRPGYGAGAGGPRPGYGGGAGGGPRPGYGGGAGGDRRPRPGGAGGGRPGYGAGAGGPRPGYGGGVGGGPRPGFGGGRPGFGPAGAVVPKPGAGKPGAGKPGGGKPGTGKPGGKKDWERGRGREDEGRWLERGGRSRRQEAPRQAVPKWAIPQEITLTGPLTVGELAALLKLPSGEVIKKLLAMGMMATINQQIDLDTATIVAHEFGCQATIKLPETEPTDEELLRSIAEEDPALLRPRPPVVTVLGHVDHGKTTLLDAIRQTRVASGEAGGITQHIGASVVEKSGKRIVFLDTPGHEAFTAMRARGAKVTDVAVLVVAADDGAMPQTLEAMNHAKAAGVPIVVAVNKIDKPGANPDRVKQQLSDHGLVPEEWGGDTIYVHVSALKKQGIDDLLEMINLVAEMQNLRANPDRPAVGTVIEARVDKGRGPVATVLVQAGTLCLGDAFVAGTSYGKVRAMIDDAGDNLKEAGPATPVEVLGFEDVPEAGDIFRVVADDKAARNMAEVRRLQRREEDMASRKVISLADFYKKVQEGAEKELKLIIKADVQGSVEALRSALEKLHNEEAKVTVVHGAVGGVNESDVMLASASGAIVIGFNVRPDSRAADLAQESRVEIKTYRVIYDAIQDVEAALAGMLTPKIEEVVVGRAEVRDTFRVPNVGTVAGLYVTEGKVQRNARVRVLRDGVVVHEGAIASLKRFKEDAREVAAGYECGLGIDKFNDIKVGDVIEVFVEQEVERQPVAAARPTQGSA